MSHFLLLVLVERDPTAKHWRATPPDDYRRRLRELMARYWCSDLSLQPWCKCDSYVVGGWYDGILYGKPQERGLRPAQAQERFGVAFEKVSLQENVRPVAEIPAGVQPFALLCPGGEWLDLEADGANEIAGALKSFSECLAIVVDCHC